MAGAEVLIVGAGLAGCSVAFHVAPHRSVLLLDQGAQAGAEASAHNAGMVRRMGEDPCERALALRTAAWLADPEDGFEDASRRVGAVLGLAHDATHLHDAAAHLRARGVRVEACDRPGELAPALRGAPLLHAWYLPDERVADAHALVSGFLAGARRHGARSRFGVRIEALLVAGGRCVGVRTGDGELRAEAVVLAGGAWSGDLARAAGLHRPLVPLRRTLLQSAPHPASGPDHPWCWVDDAGVYVRPETGGWLCSPCDEAVAAPATGPGPVHPLRRALAHDKLERLLPALADLRFTGGWTGLRTFAPDRAPLLGADPELPGLWWAAGLGGFGVTCSFAVGECVAAWMRGETVPWIRPEGVSPGRDTLRRWAIRPDGDLGSARLVGVGG